jgi:hypothetical protein
MSCSVMPLLINAIAYEILPILPSNFEYLCDISHATSPTQRIYQSDDVYALLFLIISHPDEWPVIQLSFSILFYTSEHFPVHDGFSY